MSDHFAKAAIHAACANEQSTTQRIDYQNVAAILGALIQLSIRIAAAGQICCNCVKTNEIGQKNAIPE